MFDRRTLLACLLGGSMLASSTLLPITADAENGTLTIAQSFDPQSLWPNWSTTAENLSTSAEIVESLFWMNPATNKLVPLLAESYEMVDAKTAKLHLRKGVSFSNGEPMNADAVVHSIEVFSDTKQTPAYGRFGAMIDKVEALDDSTVLLSLKAPYPAIELMFDQIFITPPKYWDQVGAATFGQKPIGTGPFVLKEWIKDDHITMTRNPNYWGKAPEGVSTITWRPVPNDMSRAAGLLTGQYDVAENMPVGAIPQFDAQKDAKLIAVPSFRIFTIILSTLPQNQGPLQKKEVRQALNYAVDKKALLEGLFFGKGQLLDGQLLRRNELGFDPAVKDYPYDPAKAKAMLAAAGYPDGFTLNFKFPTGRYAQDREVATAVAGMLAKVGVKATMISLEAGQYLDQLSSRQLGPMALTGLAPGNDPDLQMGQYRSDWRYSYVQNPELDKLIDAGAAEMDPAKRTTIYNDMAVLVHDEAPTIFLYQGTDFWATSARVSGFLPRGDGQFRLIGVAAK